MKTRLSSKQFFVLSIILGFLATIVLGANLMARSAHSEELASQQEQILALRNQVEMAKSVDADRLNQLSSSATGYDGKRKAADDERLERIMSTATTWSSHAEYTKARRKLLTIEKIDPESQMMTQYMPEVGTIKDRTGKTYNKIDTGRLNMTFDSIKTITTRINGSLHTYFSVVTVSSTSPGTKATKKTVSLVTATIDNNGMITDISVVPGAGDPTRY